MTDKIPSDAVVLSEAYGMHIRALGKYWALAATITVIAITADTTSPTVELFGFEIGLPYFYPACAIFGAILNFAYCVSHLQAYRAGDIFRDYLDTIGASGQEFTPKSTVVDAAHLLYPSAINRVFPIQHFLPKMFSTRFVYFLKLPVDLFVFALPLLGCVYASFQLKPGWLSWAIWVLVVASSMVSMLLVTVGVKWIFSTKKATVEKSQMHEVAKRCSPTNRSTRTS